MGPRSNARTLWNQELMWQLQVGLTELGLVGLRIHGL